MADSKLHELLAVLPNLKAQEDTILKETTGTFKDKREHFVELHAEFEPIVADENEARELRIQVASDLEDRQKGMVTTVRDKLDYTAKYLEKAWDASFQVESTNRNAVADLVILGHTVATELPATFLLQLEKRIVALKEVLKSAPTLDPTKGFTQDSERSTGIYKARETERVRTKKKKRHEIVAPATDKHPAQVISFEEDVPVGRIRYQEWSSMLTPAEKSELLERADTLHGAVKAARTRANQHKLEKKRVAKALTNFVLKGELSGTAEAE